MFKQKFAFDTCVIVIQLGGVNKVAKAGGVLAVIAVVIGLGLYWKTTRLGSKSINTDTVVASTPTIEMPTAAVASPTKGSTQLSVELRTKIRNTFISNCKAKVGQQYDSACNCAADYLATNYSDTQLEKIYIDYHSSSKIPSEIQAAYDLCKSK